NGEVSANGMAAGVAPGEDINMPSENEVQPDGEKAPENTEPDEPEAPDENDTPDGTEAGNTSEVSENAYNEGETDGADHSENEYLESNLGRMLRSVAIDDVDVTNDGKIKLLDDQEYDVAFAFKEGDADHQFTANMYYELPDGLVPPLDDDGKPLDDVRTFGTILSGMYNGEDLNGKTVHDNTWHIEERDGKYYIIVNLNTDDENYQYMKNMPDVEMTLWLHITKKETTKKWEFLDSDYYSGTVEFEEIKSSLTANKSCSYDEETKTLRFTVTVESTGKNSKVKLYDHIYPKTDYGTKLIYKPESLQVTSNKKGAIVTDGAADESYVENYENPAPFATTEELFTMRFKEGADLVNGEVITLTYDVEAALPDKRDFTYDVSNRFVVLDKNNKRVEAKTSRRIEANYKPGLSKKANISKNRETIDYTVTLEGYGKYDISGEKVTDELYGEIADYANYYGEGLTVKLQNGTTKKVPWDKVLRSSGKGWEYILPDDVGSQKVTITYSVKIDTTGSLPAGSLWNKVKFANLERTAETKFSYSLAKYANINNKNKNAGIWFHIEYNGDKVINSKGVVVRDRLSGELMPYAYYNTDEPITIGYNYGADNEKTEEAVVGWDKVVWDEDHKGWSLTLDDYGNDRVYISYYVKISDLSGFVSDKAKGRIANTVYVMDKHYTSGYDHNIPEDNRIGFEKTHSEPVRNDGIVSNEWTVSIKVPAGGLNSCVVTDQLPAKWVDNVYEVDELLEGSLSVSSNDGEVYYDEELGYSDGNNSRVYKDLLTLTFYKDAAKTEE
ncbi:MAG: hypothetical protein IJT24_04605, partial [Lachnospiraceae bacterium]|nr:hypothetical protein [Lachnospiraceae bacterium]